ncbi:hypothetical protein BGZ95_010477 [Linnemannia exigua]|uniref:Uncharacterized protein n=1 Tax=Linnemannia exigua TaxID=604196 RepID=A0AAD4DBA9_9FUNG|nr:hypothetical protein BGZ95_010477 [Linnemannia exigua]
MEIKSSLSSQQTNHLLCSAPNLKELYFACTHEVNLGGWLEAGAIVQSDWICNNLEVLACKISEIPRPDITREIYFLEPDRHLHPGSPQRSMELQRQVYSKLAKLTKLRELRLGFVLDSTHPSYALEDEEIFRQYDCLAMTLESGLDLLKNLQNLQVVDLSNMEVYIDGESERSFSWGGRVDWNRTFWDCCQSGYALKTNGHHVQSLELYFDSDSHMYYDYDQANDFFEFSPTFFPRLTSVTLCGMRNRGDLVVDIINKGSEAGWKELKFSMFDDRNRDRSVVDGDGMVKAILRQAPTLEVLNLDGGAYFKSKEINKLLCSAPRLVELQLLGNTRTLSDEEPCLDANDVVQSEWVCTNLEIFGCAIRGIPRHDITRRINDEPASNYTCPGSYQDGVELQRGVYSQLSRLIKLKELYLGSPLEEYEDFRSPELELDDDVPRRDCPSRQFDCLAMTLDSGLDQLKDLKDLHWIDMKDMEVYIDKPKEQKWVGKNWPRVTRIFLS